MKNEFLSISHELRTPLMSIDGSLTLLIRMVGGELATPAARLLSIAQASTQRLINLVNDFLDIEKLEAGMTGFRFEAVALRPLAEQTIEANLGFAGNYGVRLRHDVDAEAAAWADPDRLAQVVTNLVSNAVKYSPPDSEVAIAAALRGNSIRLSVRDRGAGIPADFRPRLFQKFAQADGRNSRKGAGTGLGLSIVKEIVTRLGGEVGFDDVPGGGTIFYVDLPRWAQGAAREPLKQIA